MLRCVSGRQAMSGFSNDIEILLAWLAARCQGWPGNAGQHSATATQPHSSSNKARLVFLAFTGYAKKNWKISRK